MKDVKHAYLILAHQEFDVLKCLLEAIDDARNDIFIHFDKKVELLPQLNVSKANIIILDKRESIYWGDVSMLYAEYALLLTANNHGNYAYYHLLSGVDMPLKDQDTIHEFFNLHNGALFIGYSQANRDIEIKNRTSTYHILTKYFRNDSSFMYAFSKLLRFVVNHTQRMVGLKRNAVEEIKLGPQWFSVPADFVAYLIENKVRYLNMFRNTFCSDELFVQTAAWNSSFKDRLYNIFDEFDGCVRDIQWKNGQLLNWEIKNLPELLNSKAMFARKFSTADMNVVYAILKISKSRKYI